MSIIICGSRKYDNRCFDTLVDSFDTIVRTNMLLPNCGYGKRESDYQSLNCHIYDNYTRNVGLEEWLRYKERLTLTSEHIAKFKDYLDNSTKTKFIFFPENNTQVFRNFFRDNNLSLKIHKQLRNGFSYIGKCLKDGTKPFLVGFSLKESSYNYHQYRGKVPKINNTIHDANKEIEIIKILHNNGFIDATFCCIEDEETLTMDTSVIEPTEEGIQIWKGVIDG